MQGIKDMCSLTDKQTKRTCLHSDGWKHDCSEQNKEKSVQNACLLLELWKLSLTTLFAIKQLVVYSECNILNETFYSVKELKQLHVCQIQQQKKINQRDTE